MVSSALAQVRITDWEPDYVHAALKPSSASGPGCASALESPRAYHVARLWQRPAGPWASFVEAAKLKIRAELVGAGWQVKEVLESSAKEKDPCSFVLEARKEARGLRFYITFIPADDRSFYASYTQAAF
jgi:hypothetical protein